MNRPSIVTRHGAGRLFKKCLAARTAQRRMLKAFALCTLPAMSIGQAWGQDRSYVPPAVDELVTAEFQSADDVGSARVSPTADFAGPGVPMQQGGFVMPPALDGGDDGVVRLGDTAVTSPVEPAQYEGPITSSMDPYAGSTVSADSLGYARSVDNSLVMWRVTRDNLDIAGVPSGWTGLSAFMPIGTTNGDDLYFFNPRLLLDDNGRAGGNIGLGKRWYDSVSNTAHELSFWGDVDSGYNNSYGQMGVSAATIAGNWEFRLGANWIVTDKYNTLTDIGPADGVVRIDPDSTAAMTLLTQDVEIAYDRYDFEVAVPFAGFGQYGATAGFGGYYLDTESVGREGAGVQGRFEVQFNENFWANVTVSNDKVFDTNVSFNFEFTLPDGRSSKWLTKPCPRDYLNASTRRRYRPMVSHETITSLAQILDKDGNPVDIAVIDPNVANTTDGLGTINSPFTSLEDFTEESAAFRSGFDILVVRPNTDPNVLADFDLNTTIALSDGQALISDALAYSFTGSGGGAPFRFTLDPLRYNNPLATSAISINDPILLPTLSNSANPGVDVITLANNNAVQGLRIDAGNTADGIFGAGITNFDISHNEFTRFIDAVDISHVGDGYGSLENNFVKGRVTAAGATTLADLGVTLADLGFTLDDFANATISRTPTEAEILARITFDPTTATASITDPTTGAVTPLIDPATGSQVVLPVSASQLNLTLADLGLSIDQFTTVEDFPVQTEADAIAFLSLGNDGVNGNLGNGFGRTGGLIVTSDGNLDVLVRNNLVQGVAGEDVDQNNILGLDEDLDMDGVIDPGEDVNGNGVLDTTEDINGNGILDAGRGISVVALSGTIEAASPDIVPVYDTTNAYCPTVLPTGIIGNKVGEFQDDADGDGLPEVVANSGAVFGIEVVGQPGTVITLVERDNMVGGGVGAPAALIDPGYLIDADGSTILVPEFSGNMSLGSSEDGGQFFARNGGTLIFDAPGFLPGPSVDPLTGEDYYDTNLLPPSFRDNVFATAQGDGLLISADNGDIYFDAIGTSLAADVLAVNQFINNDAAGVRMETANNGTITVEQPIAGNTISGNAGDGFVATADTGTIDIAFGQRLLDGTTLRQTFTNNGGDGIHLITLNGGVITSSLSGVSSTLNAGAGAAFDIDGTAVTLAGINNANFDQNAVGLRINVDNGGSFTTPSITNSTFNSNTEAGLLITGADNNGDAVDDISTVNLGEVSGNQFNRAVVLDDTNTTVLVPESGGFGIQFDTQNVVTNGVFKGNEFVGQRIYGDPSTDTDGDGILDGDGVFEQIRPVLEGDGLLLFVGEQQFSQSTAAVIDANGAIVSPASGNLQPGVGGYVENGGVNLTFGSLALASDSNTFDGNGDAHIGLVFSGNSANNVSVLNSILRDADDAQNSILPASFDGDGVSLELQDTSTLSGSIQGNWIVGNRGDGVDIEVGGNSAADFASVNDYLVQNNLITGNGRSFSQFADNGNNGIELMRTSTGEFNNFQIIGNIVDRNANNGLFIDASGAFKVDTIIANNNSFSDNGWVSFVVDVSDPALIQTALDNGQTLVEYSTSTLSPTNLIFLPDDLFAPYGSTFFQAATTFADPADGIVKPDALIVDGTNGFDILLDPTNDIPIANRIGTDTAAGIAGDDANGVYIAVSNDAIVDLNMDGNDINRNRGAGVEMEEQVLLATDQRSVSGTWVRNTFDENQEDGIDIDAATDNLSIGVIGDATSRNFITNNASDGIEVRAAGNLIIASNLISGNGTNAQSGTGELGLRDFEAEEGGAGGAFSQIAGIDLDVLNVSQVAIDGNEIINNTGDAIEWSNQLSFGFGNSLTVTGNTLRGNDGRGFDFLLQASPTNNANNGFSSEVAVIFNDNLVSDNRLQGVYVVATNDTDQQQNVRAGDAMLAGGSVEAAYFLNLEMSGNEVVANGIDVQGGIDGRAGSADESSGVVIRVGSTDGRDSFRSDGGFASEGETFVNSVVDPLQPGAVFGSTSQSLFLRGGVIMSMLNNSISSNFGSDLYFESFTSTADPADTGGTWEQQDFTDGDLEFVVNAFRGDPLARLDLTFRNNAIALGQADVTNVGATYGNAEADFKSRVDNNGNNDEDGPFSSGARLRNAQRGAARLYPNGENDTTLAGEVLPPLAINADDFEFRYPGIGDSTFRVNINGLSDADLLNLEALGFIFDDAPLGDPSPIESSFEMNGIILNGPGNRFLDDPIFGWGTYVGP